MTLKTLWFFIKTVLQNHILFLFLHATPASDNPLCWRKNPLERIQKLIIIIDLKFWDEKLQYNIKRETAKISILSSVKIDKHEYLIGKEILLSDQKRVIEQTKFVYSLLGKGFEKQTKTIEDQD